MTSNLSFTRVLVALYFVYTALALPTFDAFVDNSGNGNNITIAVNVPSDNPNDLFFHYHAPAQWQWSAFGFGGRMKGSLIFLMYTSQNGNNVTVSPRIATGQSMPLYTKDVTLEILNGTGLMNNATWVVNARCSGCRKWTGGSIDITSENQDMIYAVGPKTTGFKSDDLKQQITQHSSHGTFTLNLKKATGEGGIPVLTAQDTNPTVTNGEKEEPHEFPIMVHALLVIACFLVILPAGYLFLRVFNRVWLHAGIQSLGLVCLLAGVAAGIVFNVQSQRAMSYHQVLGMITTVLVLAAFTLGLISHQYFKKRKVSSPLLKFHRMAGPAAILFGNGTVISGFAFRGEPRRILPYSMVFLGVLIFVGAIGFLMKKRAVRKAAMTSTAAQNFNQGYYQQNVPPPPVPSAYGNSNQGYFAPNSPTREGLSMQTFSGPFGQYQRQQAQTQAQQPPQQQQRQQQQSGYGQGYGYGQRAEREYKAPNVSTRPINQI